MKTKKNMVKRQKRTFSHYTACCYKERVEPTGEALRLSADLCSNPHLRSPAVGKDQQTELQDTGMSFLQGGWTLPQRWTRRSDSSRVPAPPHLKEPVEGVHVAWTPPWGGAPGMSNQEATRQTQDTLERFYLSIMSLHWPWCPPRRSGGGSW